MSIYKTRAVVIKSQDFKENDKLVCFYTEKLGKINAVVRRAKSNKGRYLSLTLPFCYGEYVFFKGRSMFTLNEGEIIESFQCFLNDLKMLTYASYAAELVDISMQQEESNRELFKDFVITYYLLKSNACDMDTLMRSFELKVLLHTGYGLNFDYCCLCRKPIKFSNYINFKYSGGVCENCPKEDGMYISNGTYSALKYLNKFPLAKINRINLSEKIKSEVEKVLEVIISQNYSRKPKSINMINLLKRSEKNG